MFLNAFFPSTVADVMSSTDSAFSSLGLFSLLGGDGRFSPIIISANSIFDTLFACTVSIYFPALITDISSAISRTSSSL